MRVLATVIMVTLLMLSTGSGRELTPGQRSAEAARSIAGPHLTGAEYVALREDEHFEAIVFTLTETDAEGSKVSRVIIGPDIVIEKGPLETTIYDFRYHRLLKLPKDGTTFANDSLFGLFLMRWEYLQNNLRASASKEFGEAKEASLSRYWNEQNNGLTVPLGKEFDSIADTLPLPEIRVMHNSDDTTFSIGDVNVLDARWSNERYPTPDHADVFAAWSIWALRIHAQLAEEMRSSNRVPFDLEYLTNPRMKETPETKEVSFSEIKKGTGSIGELKGRDSQNLNWEPWLSSNLVEQMISAVRGTGESAFKPELETISQMEDLTRQSDYLSAVLLGVHDSLPFGGCKSAETNPLICTHIINTITNVRSNALVAAYFEAMRLDQYGQHGDAAHGLIALRAHEIERIDLLDLAIASTLVGAKRKNQLDEGLELEFARIPRLHEAAFRRDPYNPVRYREVRDYLYAAVENTSDAFLAHIYAYPIIDLARSLPYQRLSPPVARATNVEAEIVRDFPVLFPRSEKELSVESRMQEAAVSRSVQNSELRIIRQ